MISFESSFRFRKIRAYVLSASLMLCSFSAQSQEAAVFRTLQIDGPRALAEAILDITHNHPGTIITYEDVRYRDSGDIQDVTGRVPGAGERRLLGPRNSSIRAEYSVLTESNRLAEPDVAITRIVEAYNSANNPGNFTIERTGSIFHVVPLRSRDTDGNWVSEQPIFDLTVSFDAPATNGLEVANRICEELSSVTGSTIGLGVAPFSLLASKELDFSVSDEKARDVMVRLLAEIEPALTWQLNYDPFTEWYFLNLLSADPPKVIMDARELELSSPIELDPNSGSIFRPRRD